MNSTQIAQTIQDIVADAFALGYRDVRKIYDHPYFKATYGQDVMSAFKQSLTQSPQLFSMIQSAIEKDLEAAE